MMIMVMIVSLRRWDDTIDDGKVFSEALMSIIMAIIANIIMIIIMTTTTSSSSSSSFQNSIEPLPRGHDTATPRGPRSENQRRAGFILARFPDTLATGRHTF